MTQRTASTRLDLPQPFGPTTPVSPGSISKSVGSTKDLKPIRRSRVSFIRVLFHLPCCGGEGNHQRLTPFIRRVESCRIGAENKSSRPRAQQRRRVIQIFAPEAPARGRARVPAGARAKSKNPYPCLR